MRCGSTWPKRRIKGWEDRPVATRLDSDGNVICSSSQRPRLCHSSSARADLVVYITYGQGRTGWQHRMARDHRQSTSTSSFCPFSSQILLTRTSSLTSLKPCECFTVHHILDGNSPMYLSHYLYSAPLSMIILSNIRPPSLSLRSNMKSKQPFLSKGRRHDV